jgi:hypothetical protein
MNNDIELLKKKVEILEKLVTIQLHEQIDNIELKLSSLIDKTELLRDNMETHKEKFLHLKKILNMAHTMYCRENINEYIQTNGLAKYNREYWYKY